MAKNILINRDPKPIQQHDRYTWEVHTVAIEDAQKVLNSLSLGTHEIVSTHIAVAPSVDNTRGELKMVIVARQSQSVADAIANDTAFSTALKNQTLFPPTIHDLTDHTVPFDAYYASECKHAERGYAKGSAFEFCQMCQKMVRWRIVKPLD